MTEDVVTDARNWVPQLLTIGDAEAGFYLLCAAAEIGLNDFGRTALPIDHGVKCIILLDYATGFVAVEMKTGELIATSASGWAATLDTETGREARSAFVK